MKKAILTILIILMMTSNALAYCGAFTQDAEVLGAAWSLELYADSYAAITDVASYATTTTDLSNAWTNEEIGEPECEQTYDPLTGDFNKAYETMFDSPTPDYQKTFFNENTNVITTVAAFNGNPGSVSVVSINSDTYATIFKNNYEWNADAITFTGATYDSSTGYTTISANAQDTGADVQIIFTINSAGAEVYTTQIGIDGNNMKSRCIEMVSGNLVTCTLVNSHSGVTTINPDNGMAISTVGFSLVVNPLPEVGPYDVIGTIFEQPEASAGEDTIILCEFSIASNGAITPTASEYTSLDATWDSLTGIKILSEGVTAVYGITNDGLTSYPTVSVYNTLTNTQIFGYRMQNENAVIADVTVTADGDIAVAATDETAGETSVYLFNSAGVLQDSGKIPDFSAYTIDAFTVQSGAHVIMIGGKNIAGNPTTVQIDPDFTEGTVTTQDITANIVDAANNLKVFRIETLSGSYGIQIYGITANPDVPEFSLTTLLLATLLAGGLVLFVVRRKYK